MKNNVPNLLKKKIFNREIIIIDQLPALLFGIGAKIAIRNALKAVRTNLFAVTSLTNRFLA